MDAAAFPKAAQKVVQILWEIGTIKSGSDLLWVKARTAAFLSLINYEVKTFYLPICFSFLLSSLHTKSCATI